MLRRLGVMAGQLGRPAGRLLGYANDEALDQALSRLWPDAPGDSPDNQAPPKAASIPADRAEYQDWIVRKNGTRFKCVLCGALTKSGEAPPNLDEDESWMPEFYETVTGDDRALCPNPNQVKM